MVFHEAIQITSCLLRGTFDDDTVHVFQFLISSRVVAYIWKNVPRITVVIQIWNDAFHLVSCCLPKKIKYYSIYCKRTAVNVRKLFFVNLRNWIWSRNWRKFNLSSAFEFFAIMFRNTLIGSIENMNHITFAST